MNKSSNRACATALLALGCSGLLSATAQAADIHVLATGALSAAFRQLGPDFEKKSGHHLVVAWGPSYGSSPDALPMRIQAGEAMDACFMIKAAMADQIKQGKLLPATAVDLAESRVGVAVRAGLPRPDIASVDGLRATLLAAKSVAFSEGASGKYIVGTLFPELGIADAMKAKSVPIHGRELVGTAIERGDADLGLQQISELRAIPGIQYVGPLPEAVQKVSVISAAIGKDARERKAAEAFLAYLKTPDAAATFVKTGLDPIGAK
ncbi:substrate-binding domain-containing protein [Massilia sp. CT11-137]|uniref:substrate-binding domain-containing protein n=1 Tax=Massilia sp. CT11-137 TaxID=3393901 RepID=UPI0039A710D4